MFWTLHIFTHLKLPVGTRWNSQTRPFSKRFQMHSLVFRFHHTGVRQFFTTKKYHWTDKSKIVQKDHKVYSFVFFDIVIFLFGHGSVWSIHWLGLFFYQKATHWASSGHVNLKMMVSKFGSSLFPGVWIFQVQNVNFLGSDENSKMFIHFSSKICALQ